MSNPLLAGVGLATLLAGGAVAAGAADSSAVTPAAAAPAAASGNPLLAPWSGPYGGVPPFDLAKVELFRPALEAAMAEQLTEIAAIADQSEPPTFANTIAALEGVGRALDRVNTVFEIFDEEQINLSRIESRPRRGEMWQYVFFTDFEGHRRADGGSGLSSNGLVHDDVLRVLAGRS